MLRFIFCFFFNIDNAICLFWFSFLFFFFKPEKKKTIVSTSTGKVIFIKVYEVFEKKQVVAFSFAKFGWFLVFNVIYSIFFNIRYSLPNLILLFSLSLSLSYSSSICNRIHLNMNFTTIELLVYSNRGKLANELGWLLP